ncbi:MAG TPA: hypothetical protein VJT50_01750 [Pyrinomonadaceae bacterium]|nr:hypothetical protein [Pyrinomonadaceae bacterium]
MNTNTQGQHPVALGDGGVWYRLHAEREKTCTQLLQPTAKAAELQERLRLIDNALDRLMAGSYGDCVVCGRWIDDDKLQSDPVLPLCCACQRAEERKTATTRLHNEAMIMRPTEAMIVTHNEFAT